MSADPNSADPDSANDLWPTEIRLLRDKRTLKVTFDNGETLSVPAELLRVKSPSAEVQGHSPAERKLVPGKAEVTITAVQPVGNYAVRLVFDDGHSTGIYTWHLLAELGRDPDRQLLDYAGELKVAGLSRLP